MKRVALAILAVMVAGLAWAEDAPSRNSFITGLGTKKCSDYIAATERDRLDYIAYATGFVSAYNAFGQTGKQMNWQPEDIRSYLIRGCSKNLQAEIGQALAWFVTKADSSPPK